MINKNEVSVKRALALAKHMSAEYGDDAVLVASKLDDTLYITTVDEVDDDFVEIISNDDYLNTPIGKLDDKIEDKVQSFERTLRANAEIGGQA